MNTLHLMLAAALAAAVTGCVSLEGAAPFDPAEGAYIFKRGTGRIVGQAYLLDREGGTIAAAGSTVVLIPVTAYSRARVSALYGRGNYAPLEKDVGPASSEYQKQARTTRADGDGRFSFANVFPGQYYVLTQVSFQVPGSAKPEGGKLKEDVAVRENTVSRIVMSGP
jgi:hypothetical protein